MPLLINFQIIFNQLAKMIRSFNPFLPKTVPYADVYEKKKKKERTARES